jgi:hypothetical protein
LHTMLDAAGCDRKPATSLDPADGQAIINVQSRPPKT